MGARGRKEKKRGGQGREMSIVQQNTLKNFLLKLETPTPALSNPVQELYTEVFNVVLIVDNAVQQKCEMCALVFHCNRNFVL